MFNLINQESFDNVTEKWLPEIKHFNPHTPFILVGTHLDVRNDRAFIKKSQKETNTDFEVTQIQVK